MTVFDALARRAYAGVRVVKADSGLRVESIDVSAALGRAGVEAGDVLVTAGGVALDDDATLKGVIRGLRAGDSLRLRVSRAGSVREVTVALDAWPVESYPGATVSLGSVARDGYRLRTIAVAPRVAGACPAVFFVQGYSCATVERPDMIASHDGLRALIGAMVGEGYAVWRVEKRGVGDSEGEPCTTQGFVDEHEDFGAALASMLAHPSVDRSRVVIFGHSLGATHAPALAARFPEVRGLVVYGGGIAPWTDYLDVNGRRQMRLAGVDDDGIEAIAAARRRFFHAVLVEGQSPHAALARDAELMGARSWFGLDAQGRIDGRCEQYWREVNSAPAERWFAETRVPVLSIWGTDDPVSERDEHVRIAEVVGRGRFVELDGADHAMMRGGVFDGRVAREVLGWMRAISA